MPQLTIDVWSDIACPWCYVGKRHLEAAVEQLGKRAGFQELLDDDGLQVRWRSFELDPAAPAVRDPAISYVDRLARKYRVPSAQAQSMIDHMVTRAADDGLDFRFDIIQPGNTFDAHRLLHYAGTVGAQGRLKERLLRGYLCEGKAIGDKATLLELASNVEMNQDRVAEILASEDFAEDVRSDQSQAQAMNVSGVPFFLLNGSLSVPGAQPTEVMMRVLERAWTQRPREQELADGDGASCDATGC